MAIITFTLEPARTIDIDTDNLTLTNVSDNQVDLIIASIEGFWRGIILWQGADEYASAGTCTSPKRSCSGRVNCDIAFSMKDQSIYHQMHIIYQADKEKATLGWLFIKSLPTYLRTCA